MGSVGCLHAPGQVVPQCQAGDEPLLSGLFASGKKPSGVDELPGLCGADRLTLPPIWLGNTFLVERSGSPTTRAILRTGTCNKHPHTHIKSRLMRYLPRAGHLTSMAGREVGQVPLTSIFAEMQEIQHRLVLPSFPPAVKRTLPRH